MPLVLLYTATYIQKPILIRMMSLAVDSIRSSRTSLIQACVGVLSGLFGAVTVARKPIKCRTPSTRVAATYLTTQCRLLGITASVYRGLLPSGCAAFDFYRLDWTLQALSQDQMEHKHQERPYNHIIVYKHGYSNSHNNKLGK